MCVKNENTLIHLDDPTVVIGDLHGNYADLMKFAKYFGLWYLEVIPKMNFLFLGDYVDRGQHQIETLAFLLALKILFPQKVYLCKLLIFKGLFTSRKS